MAATLLADRTLLLEKLAEYGHSGSFALLATINNTLHDVKLEGKSCTIPIETGTSVLKQCMRVLKNSNNSDRKSSVWHLLFYMCNRQSNTLVSELLTAIEATDILRHVPKSISNLSVGNELETMWCLQFVACFGRSSGHRPAMIGRTEGIIESILHALDTKFEPQSILMKGTLIVSLSTSVYAGVPELTETFLQKDGFRIVTKAFHFLLQEALYNKASRTTAFGAIEVDMLKSCLCAVSTMFCAGNDIDAPASEVPRSMYSYDPAGLIRMNSALHDFISLSEDPSFIESTIMLICCYLSFVEKVHPESLEFVLLYRGKKLSPTTYSSVPMVIKAVLTTRNPQYRHLAESAQDCLLRCSNIFPAVDKMIDEYLSKEPVGVPSSGPAPNVCALPGCNVSSNGGSHLLKQCGRCRAVYYCAEDHQKEHWKEHKLVCVQKI